MIKVGVDLTDLKYAQTGQKTYLESIAKEFKELNDQAFEFHFFASPFPNFKSKNIFLILTNHLLLQCWKQIILPIQLNLKKCDIIFCTDYYVPLLHINFKSVQVIHDTFFFEYPNHYNKHWMLIYKTFSLPATYKSSFIIAPTNYSKTQINKKLNIPIQKIVTISEGPKIFDSTQSSSHFLEIKHIIPESPYFLHVGVFEKRKNLLFLLKAFHAFKIKGHINYKLILVGKGTGRVESDDSKNIMNLIADLQLQNDVILTGYLSENLLKQVYQKAFAYIFPSYNEGFGIPTLEAFQFDLPVLVANNSCLPEVGGDAVLSFDPYNQNDLLAKMELICTEPAIRFSLIEKGRERLKLFTWQNTAKELLTVFKRTINTN
jgi:glycosyltransferase involved in cell wall biosynthesis